MFCRGLTILHLFLARISDNKDSTAMEFACRKSRPTVLRADDTYQTNRFGRCFAGTATERFIMRLCDRNILA
jgi:hypothetical protein